MADTRWTGAQSNLWSDPANWSNGLPDADQKAIADRIITAYDGASKVIVDTTSTAGRIVVKGLHPFQPVPVDGSRISAGTAELTWTLPDPCQPGKPVLVDVYFGTSPDFPVGGSVETPQIVKQKGVSSLVVQTKPKTRYYWAVDMYFGNAKDPVFGPIFSFVADNLVPTVNAGDDAVAWLKDGSAKAALNATVTDDGFLQAYTPKWSVVSEPNQGMAVLTNPQAEDTVVTFKATGQYELKLEANDGEYTGSDTIAISVFADSCEAAKSLPGYQPLPGDLNGDCEVSDADLAILQSNWLKCSALDCNDVKK